MRSDDFQNGAIQLGELKGDRQRREFLLANFPEIFAQLKRLSKQPELLDLWSNSLNVDENAKQTIVDPKILQTIGKVVKCAMNGPAYHSGLLHTYGYLFSVIETPYGMKRDRWTQPKIENGLKLPKGSLSPYPDESSLLANATWFFGNISLTDNKKAVSILDRAEGVSASLKKFSFESLVVKRITESFSLEKNRVQMRTDLVRFLPRRKDQKQFQYLLIYSTKSNGQSKLLTAFSITQRSFDELISETAADPISGEISKQFGSKKPITVHYNAAIAGYQNPVLGTRRLHNLEQK